MIFGLPIPTTEIRFALLERPSILPRQPAREPDIASFSSGASDTIFAAAWGRDSIQLESTRECPDKTSARTEKSKSTAAFKTRAGSAADEGFDLSLAYMLMRPRSVPSVDPEPNSLAYRSLVYSSRNLFVGPIRISARRILHKCSRSSSVASFLKLSFSSVYVARPYRASL